MPERSLRLLNPTLATIAGVPGLTIRGGDLSMLRIGESNRCDIAAQRNAVRDRFDLSPVAAGVGRVIQRTRGSPHPDIGTVVRERPESRALHHRHGLPGLA